MSRRRNCSSCVIVPHEGLGVEPRTGAHPELDG